MQEIAVELVYAVKPRRRSYRLAKSTFRVSTIFTSLLFAVRTSTIATASKEVTMFTSTHITIVFIMKRSLFSVV